MSGRIIINLINQSEPIDIFELILWFISIAVLFVIAFVFMKDYLKIKNTYFFYLSLFFILLIVARIFRLIVKFYIGEPPIGRPFEGEAFFFESLFLITMYIALFFIYFAIERNILKKTYFIFSILVCILCVIAIINLLFFNILLYIAIVLFIVTIAGLPLIFFSLGIKTSGELRKSSFFVVLGAVLAEIGLAFDIPEGYVIWNEMGVLSIIKLLAPILQIAGFMLINKGFPKLE
ncbi:MAG: hypothetical protein ACTSR8_03950 [Promethearchaeota archaeon]